MGLGLHGGGLSSVLFFSKRGADVTVTDLKDSEALKNTIDKLKGLNIRYVLGHHDMEDFSKVDLVIKNPAVPLNSPFLKAALSNKVPVETDISIFLREIRNNPLIAVTGSKGKSTTASAVYYCLRNIFPGAKLGGNITISPLSFVDSLKNGDPVVLELSSWQLADIKDKDIFNPFVSVLTSIMPDHMDRYSSMKDYIEDKKIIFKGQTGEHFTLFNYDDDYQKVFFEESSAKQVFYSKNILPVNLTGAFLKNKTGYINGTSQIILPEELKINGEHNRMNLLAAAMACFLLVSEKNKALHGKNVTGKISSILKDFPGIEHRLEYFHEKNGIRFYNDSAATIPQAMAAAVNSIKAPLILITGGTDKNIDFSGIESVLKIPDNIILLKGTGTDKIIPVLESNNIMYSGPFDSLKKAVFCALSKSKPGTSIVFSPGCTSFGMFKNEFDRGNRFKEIVKAL
jgi:UDP-N-acetylmuramoylalanine--D-glutamate ligase